MDITIKENGDLLLTVTLAEREDIREALHTGNRHAIIGDLFEPYSCNGSFTPFDAGDANPFVGLTSAPCVAECMDTDDDGKNVIQGRFWYYANYQIEDELDALAETGECTFTLAR